MIALKESGQRIRRTRSRLLFRERPALEGKELRVPSTTAGDGSAGRASAGGRTASDSRSRHRRGQIAGLPGAVGPVRAGAAQKAIVSTHTINLQEQLLHKDIPILKKVLPVEFEAALMKGRQNYLCPRRLERALQNEQELFTGPERSELQRLAEWARTTRDGSLSDLSVEPDPKVWAQVCSEAHICTKRLVAKIRAVSISRPANVSWQRTSNTSCYCVTYSDSYVLLLLVANSESCIFPSVAVLNYTPRPRFGYHRCRKWAGNTARQRDALLISQPMGSIQRLHRLSAAGGVLAT